MYQSCKYFTTQSQTIFQVPAACLHFGSGKRGFVPDLPVYREELLQIHFQEQDYVQNGVNQEHDC